MSLFRKEQQNIILSPNLYHFNAGGSDITGNGSGGYPFATPQKTFQVIAALTGGDIPSQNNQYSVFCSDGAAYLGAFDMSIVEWVTVFAHAAYIKSDDIILNNNCVVSVREFSRLTPGANVIRKQGSEEASLYCTKIRGKPGDGLIYLENGILNVTTDNAVANLTTNPIITANPANPCEFRLQIKNARGFVTVPANTKGYINSDFLDGNIFVTGASPLHLNLREFTGNIPTAVSGSEIYLNYDKRNSSPSGDNINDGAFLYVNGKTVRIHRTAINYNPSVLTDHRIIAVTDTSVARTVVISTEDIQSASKDFPRYFTVKDESGLAATNNITVSGESGGFSFVIDANKDSLELYSDGTTLWLK